MIEFAKNRLALELCERNCLVIIKTDSRYLIVLLAGPNGAGKSTFYRVHLADRRLPFVNADDIAKEVFGNQEPETSIPAARLAESIRRSYVAERRTFIFETVLSDPVGAKVEFLREAQEQGYAVEAHFIGLAHAGLCLGRVACRVRQGGHDVPEGKVQARYWRSLENLGRLVPVADRLTIYDNSEIERPHRPVAMFGRGILLALSHEIPAWLDFLDLPSLVTEETTRLA